MLTRLQFTLLLISLWTILGAMKTNISVTETTCFYNNKITKHCDIENPLLDCDGDGTPNGTDPAPLDACEGGTTSLDSNDCDGDGVTVGEGDPDDQDYCTPIDFPECTVSIETDSYIPSLVPCLDTSCYVVANIKMLLQGAYDQDNSDLLRDQLRTKGLLPLKEPYANLQVYEGEAMPFKIIRSGGEEVSASLFTREGPEAIVDWVFIELRDALNPKNIVATRSVLLQRNGAVVDIDGISPVKFKAPSGNYHIAVKHRNHLGAMLQYPVPLTKTPTVTIDFSSIHTPFYQLEDKRKTSQFAQKRIEDKLYLWGGNTNSDHITVYQGPGLDQTKVFYDIFTHPENKGPNDLPNYNYIIRGYAVSDENMDGEVRYQGPNNDVDALQFFNIILHPENPSFFMNKIIYEQIPSEEN